MHPWAFHSAAPNNTGPHTTSVIFAAKNPSHLCEVFNPRHEIWTVQHIYHLRVKLIELSEKDIYTSGFPLSGSNIRILKRGGGFLLSTGEIRNPILSGLRGPDT